MLVKICKRLTRATVRPVNRALLSSLLGTSALLCLSCARGGLLLGPSTEQGLVATRTQEKDPMKLPSYQNVRYEEDGSVLRGLPQRSGTNEPLKFIPLNQDSTVYLSFGGQARFRLESWSDFGFGGLGSRDDSFGLLRLRLHSDLVAGPFFRLFFEGKSALATGRDLPGGLRIIDVDTLDLENAFADLKVPFEKGSLTFRLGRQELQFGKQRLVSPLDWTNRPRMFDGLRSTFKQGSWRIDAFWTHFVRVRKYHFNRKNSGTDFFGWYATGKLPSQLTLDLYWLGLDQMQRMWGGLIANEKRHTLGARLGGSVGETKLDFDVEAAYQLGDHEPRDIRAFMFASQLGYTLSNLPGVPRLAFGVDYASGDKDPSDAKLNTFNQLFPLGHAYLGYIDVVGRQNVVDLSQGFSFKPRSQFTIRLDGHFFWRANRNDALYNPGGGIVRNGDPTLPRRVGSEIDWTFQFRANRHTAVTFGYSHFFPGPFIAESGPADSTDFGYAMIQYTF